MIKLEDHIQEIDGVKYVPYDIVRRYVNETYTKEISKIDALVNKAFTDYELLEKLDKDDEVLEWMKPIPCER